MFNNINELRPEQCRRDSFPSDLLLLLQQILLAGNRHRLEDQLTFLPNDNWAKRNWNGSKQCSYCSAEEIFAHLFFDCDQARLVWRIIHTTFGIHRPRSITHMFGSWLFWIKGGHKNLLYMGVSALCWPFGFAEMILFLIMLKSKRVCKFFSRPHTW